MRCRSTPLRRARAREKRAAKRGRDSPRRERDGFATVAARVRGRRRRGVRSGERSRRGRGRAAAWLWSTLATAAGLLQAVRMFDASDRRLYRASTLRRGAHIGMGGGPMARKKGSKKGAKKGGKRTTKRKSSRKR